MGEYGPGLTSGQRFMLDKERIKYALNHQLVCGEDENGFLYEPCTKQESDQYILSTFDNAVYSYEQMNASCKALERLLREYAEKAGETPNAWFSAYMQYIAEESGKSDYVFEGDEEIAREEMKSKFRIIRRGETD